MVTEIDSIALLARFEEHLASTGYTRPLSARYLSGAKRFLAHLTEKDIPLEAAQPLHLAEHLRAELRRHRRRRGHFPVSLARWRDARTASVHCFLRLVCGQWPPRALAAGPREAFCQQVCSGYAWELKERRGLAAGTVCGRLAEAERFLSWICRERNGIELGALEVPDIDRYLRTRAPSLQRTTRKLMSVHLRSFLRYLHQSGRIGRDLAPTVIAPSLYRFEGTPSILAPADVKAILGAAAKDRSPQGLRNHAILMLLATYGLRAGEVTGLLLEDVDWRAERLLIRHTKTGIHSTLPLLPKVGNALLTYLRDARPQCKERQIFIPGRAPRVGFVTSTALYSMLRRHLAKLGLRPSGKRGPHLFRHSRAVSLLRADVPVKTIGDVLGHRSTASTGVYLKLADRDLRAVALEIPTQEDRS